MKQRTEEKFGWDFSDKVIDRAIKSLTKSYHANDINYEARSYLCQAMYYGYRHNEIQQLVVSVDQGTLRRKTTQHLLSSSLLN
ncbi:MAG: hypothetical protein H0U73_11635 [Tatlockia sp.]|nr:hypothetical protein [Tatlockia sp.]